MEQENPQQIMDEILTFTKSLSATDREKVGKKIQALRTAFAAAEGSQRTLHELHDGMVGQIGQLRLELANKEKELAVAQRLAAVQHGAAAANGGGQGGPVNVQAPNQDAGLSDAEKSCARNSGTPSSTRRRASGGPRWHRA